MNEADARIPATDSERLIAKRLVEARLKAQALPEYPGPLPVDRAQAYRIQDTAISLWPDAIGGWKTTMIILPEWGSDFVGKRLLAPVFRSALLTAKPGEVVEIPLIAGGFSGLEPEMVVRVGRDAPADQLQWTIDEAAAMVGELCIGAEIVGSPVPGLGIISLPVMASDFGANGGAVAGPAIPEWTEIDRLTAKVYIDDEQVAEGAIALREEVLDAFAFALGECAARGYPVRAGALITTGTLTTFHAMEPGQSARFDYGAHGELAFRAIAARPAG